MHDYPVFLSLENRRCLVVGAGGVGRRKAASLLDAGVGEVLVLDTGDPAPEVLKLADCGNAVFEQRSFDESDLEGRFLVFACTSNGELNTRIADLCEERGILCNIADCPERADFIVPAAFRRGDLTLAISTGGASPAVCRMIRCELDDMFGEEYAALLKLMARLRPLVLELGMETGHNTALFRELARSGLLEAFERQDLDKAGQILEEFLPAPMRDNIPELLDGLV
jgi:precorrin-2 dehydrogenase/sirohydrochlorin ferrochelatase